MIRKIATGAALGIGLLLAVELLVLIVAAPLLICQAVDAPDYVLLVSCVPWWAAVLGAVLYVAVNDEGDA